MPLTSISGVLRLAIHLKVSWHQTQVIAKRGHFGSFLQDEWELLERMITTVTAAVEKPITVKLRVFESMEKTVGYCMVIISQAFPLMPTFSQITKPTFSQFYQVQYAQMLEKSGASMLTVHGRTREQKGWVDGPVGWKFILQISERWVCKLVHFRSRSPSKK